MPYWRRIMLIKLSRKYLHDYRRHFRFIYPQIKPSVLAELIAQGFGYKSSIALLTDVDNNKVWLSDFKIDKFRDALINKKLYKDEYALYMQEIIHNLFYIQDILLDSIENLSYSIKIDIDELITISYQKSGKWVKEYEIAKNSRYSESIMKQLHIENYDNDMIKDITLKGKEWDIPYVFDIKTQYIKKGKSEYIIIKMLQSSIRDTLDIFPPIESNRLYIMSGVTGSQVSYTLKELIETFINPGDDILSIEKDKGPFNKQAFNSALQAALRWDMSTIYIEEINNEFMYNLMKKSILTGHSTLATIQAKNVIDSIHTIYKYDNDINWLYDPFYNKIFIHKEIIKGVRNKEFTLIEILEPDKIILDLLKDSKFLEAKEYWINELNGKSIKMQANNLLRAGEISLETYSSL